MRGDGGRERKYSLTLIQLLIALVVVAILASIVSFAVGASAEERAPAPSGLTDRTGVR